MMVSSKVRYFYAIATEGSFSKAAQRLNISQSSLSDAIAKLENSLKVSLFLRTPKGIVLTKEGEIFFFHARNMIIESEKATTAFNSRNTQIAGDLTLAAPYGFTSTNLFPKLIKFLELYSDLQPLRIVCNDENLDLKTREADVSVRNYESNDNSLQQTYLTTRIQNLYASPKYLERYGFPHKLKDLKYHNFISFNNHQRPLPYEETEWILKVGMNANEPPRQPRLILNSVECLYQAAVEGIGIVALSKDSLLLKKGELLPILPQLHSPKYEMYFVYPKELKRIKLVKALETFLVNSYQKD